MIDVMKSPALSALLAGCFTWALTALGASAVFLSKGFSRRALDIMLGFAGGVMIAASYWSLLAPALEMSESWGRLSFVPAAVGFTAGAVVLRLVDYVLPHLHPALNQVEGVHTHLSRTFLLVLAITLHNIPEGLAVGVSFGAAAIGAPDASLAGSVALALGIGLQNIPEGVAVSVPLLRAGLSRRKAFFYGQFSGLMEPVAALLGAWAVSLLSPVLPYALAFAAGAMIFVVVEDVIPESQASGNGNAATMGTMAGFVVMMIMDVALG